MKKEMTIKNKINSSSDAFLCGLFLAITIGVFGPLVLYLANINEFWFSIRDIWWITAIGGITLLILAYSISFLLRGKIRDFYVCFIFGLAMSFYLQWQTGRKYLDMQLYYQVQDKESKSGTAA